MAVFPKETGILLEKAEKTVREPLPNASPIFSAGDLGTKGFYPESQGVRLPDVHRKITSLSSVWGGVPKSSVS